MPPYIVFDLDETLAHMHSVYYFLVWLNYKVYAQNAKPGANPPREIKDELQNAYTYFVDKIAEIENSDQPLGILNPGILDLMKQLNRYKESGKIKGLVIYSNNGNLMNLIFVRDVIQKVVGSDTLFCDCIHWKHPSRAVEYIHPVKPGHAFKTWSVLSKILHEGPCKGPIPTRCLPPSDAPALAPADVYFVDDTIHEDLKKTLGHHYFQIPAYRYKTNFDKLFSLFEDALTHAGISTNLDKLTRFYHLAFGDPLPHGIDEGGILDLMYDYFSKHTTNTSSENPPPKSEFILNTLIPYFDTAFGSAGGARKTRSIKRRKNRFTRQKKQKRKSSR